MEKEQHEFNFSDGRSVHGFKNRCFKAFNNE